MRTYTTCEGCGRQYKIILTSEYFCLYCRREQEYIEKVREFREKYPWTEGGPGHVVLADYNWDCIDFCLNRINEVREGITHHEYGATPEELDATETFLNELKQFIAEKEME